MNVLCAWKEFIIAGLTFPTKQQSCVDGALFMWAFIDMCRTPNDRLYTAFIKGISVPHLLDIESF